MDNILMLRLTSIMFSGMIPMVISILDREHPLLVHTQISSLECTHNNR